MKLTPRKEQYQRACDFILLTYAWLLICFIFDISHWLYQSPIIVPYEKVLFFLNPKQHGMNLGIVWGSYLLSLALVLVFPESRFIRISSALFGLCYLALFRSMNPAWNAKDTGIFLGVLFAFLPSGWAREEGRAGRERVLWTFVGAQAIVLTPYFLSGLQKLWGSILREGPDVFLKIQFASPLSWLFLPDDSILMPYVIPFRGILWLGLWVLVFFMISSPLVLLRPILQPLWASVFISFHLLSGWTLQIFYVPQLFLVSLYFFMSPFLINDLYRLAYRIRRHL